MTYVVQLKQEPRHDLSTDKSRRVWDRSEQTFWLTGPQWVLKFDGVEVTAEIILLKNFYGLITYRAYSS